MQLELSFVIVIALVALMLCSTILGMAYLLAKQMKSQTTQIQNLTNIAVSKDLQTYSNLHALTNEPEPQKQNLEPIAFDDASMAEHLATRYAEHGIDPKYAYAQDDDPLSDFGGAEAFR